MGTTATQQTHITSNLVSTGNLIVGVDFGTGKADSLKVDGSANISGAILLSPVVLEAGTVKILDASSVSTGSISVSDFTYNSANGVITPVSPYLFTYGYTTTATTLSVTAKANFTTTSQNLNANQMEVAGHLQNIFDQGGSGGEAVLTALAGEVHGEAQYIDALESAGSESLGSMAVILPEVDQAFAASMMSCPTYAGDDATLTEKGCEWARATGGARHRDSTSESLGFNVDTWAYQVGAQRELADHWFAGGSIAYETNDIEADRRRSKLEGSGGLVGAFVKYQSGPWLLSGALSGGVDQYQTTRYITIGSVQSAAHASPDLQHAGLHAGAAYQIAFRNCI